MLNVNMPILEGPEVPLETSNEIKISYLCTLKYAYANLEKSQMF